MTEEEYYKKLAALESARDEAQDVYESALVAYRAHRRRLKIAYGRDGVKKYIDGELVEKEN